MQLRLETEPASCCCDQAKAPTPRPGTVDSNTVRFFNITVSLLILLLGVDRRSRDLSVKTLYERPEFLYE